MRSGGMMLDSGPRWELGFRLATASSKPLMLWSRGSFIAARDLLPSHRRDLYRRLIDRGAELNKRYHSHHDMTVVQGDAHYWNCFLPKDGGDDIRFFAWACWRIDVGIGTDDLAYMIALHWYPDRRHILERPLLDLYHATLTACGVTGYDRRSLV
jgi:hypothetical protein